MSASNVPTSGAEQGGVDGQEPGLLSLRPQAAASGDNGVQIESGSDGLDSADSACPPAAAAAAQLPPPDLAQEDSLQSGETMEIAGDPTSFGVEVTQSTQSSELSPPGKSWLRRAQNRAAQLRLLFNLPPDEVFMEDFMCALRKRMLLQGRMYVFSRHVCFQCNLFGYHKIKIIPLAEVTDVRKKKCVGLPNSLEFTFADGKREFFASFLARNDAYRVIMGQWRECSDRAPLSLRDEEEPAVAVTPGSASSCRNHSVKQLFRNIITRDGSSPAVSSSQRPGWLTAPTTSLHSVDEEIEASLLPSPFDRVLSRRARRRTSTGVATSGGGGGGGGIEDEPGGTSSPSLTGEPSGQLVGEEESFIAAVSLVPIISEESSGSPFAAAAAAGAPFGDGSSTGSPERCSSPERLQAEFQQLTDLQCQRALETELGHANDAPAAPPLDPAMQHVLEFDLPCAPSEFWIRFLCNSSNFAQRFHEKAGHSSIRLGKWQRHFKVGLVRDMQFVSPVKARIGPPQAPCHQSQRLQVFAGRHLVLETSQVMSDIPYADHFSVETRWDVVPHGDGVRVTVHLKIPFSKKTMWRGFIEKGTYDNILESMHQWKELAKELLAAGEARGLVRTGTGEAEWNSVFSRGSPQHTRKHSRTGSLSAGIPVGRQLPVLARHRRSPSRLASVELPGSGLAGFGSAASLAGQGAHVHFAPASPLTRRHSQQEGEQHVQHTPHHRQARQPSGVLSASTGAAQAAASLLAALLAWLVGLVRAAGRAAQALSGAPGVFTVGCIIIALQTALLLQQRQQLAQLQSHQYQAPAVHEVWLPPAAGAPLNATAIAGSGSVGGGQAAHAAAVAAVSRDLAQVQAVVQLLREQSEGWRAQLDSMLSMTAALATRLQQQAAGAPVG